MRGRAIKAIVVVSLILWGVSLFLPAYTACENLQVEGPMPEPTMGWHVALIGWGGIIGVQGLVGDVANRAYPTECAALLPPLDFGRYREISTAMLSWFANPLWAFGIYRAAKQKPLPPITLTVASILALLALQPHQEWFDHTIASYTPDSAAYVWAISIWLMLARIIRCCH